MLAPDAASFWREKVVAAVIQQRVLSSVVMAGTSYQMLEVLSFLQSGEVLTSFINDYSANFSGDKKYNEEFRGVYFLTIR